MQNTEFTHSTPSQAVNLGLESKNSHSDPITPSEESFFGIQKHPIFFKDYSVLTNKTKSVDEITTSNKVFQEEIVNDVPEDKKDLDSRLKVPDITVLGIYENEDSANTPGLDNDALTSSWSSGEQRMSDEDISPNKDHHVNLGLGRFLQLSRVNDDMINSNKNTSSGGLLFEKGHSYF